MKQYRVVADVEFERKWKRLNNAEYLEHHIKRLLEADGIYALYLDVVKVEEAVVDIT